MIDRGMGLKCVLTMLVLFFALSSLQAQTFDGGCSASTPGGGTTQGALTCNLTTTGSNDVIIAIVSCPFQGTSSVYDAAGLMWFNRSLGLGGTVIGDTTLEYMAIANTPLTNDAVTAATFNTACRLYVMAFAGTLSNTVFSAIDPLLGASRTDAAPFNITAASWDSGAQQITFTVTGNSFQPGQLVNIGGMTPSAYNKTFTAQAGTTGNTVVVNQASDPGAATGFGFAYGGYIPTSGSTGSITASPGSCVIAFYQRTSASTPGAGAGWTQFGSGISVGNSEVVEYQCGQAGGVVTPTIGTGTASNTGVVDAIVGEFYVPPAIAHVNNVHNTFMMGMNVEPFVQGDPWMNAAKFLKGPYPTNSVWTTLNGGGSSTNQEQCLPLDNNGYPTSLVTTTGASGCSPVNYVSVKSTNNTLGGPPPSYWATTWVLKFDGTGAVNGTGDGASLTGGGCGTSGSPVTGGRCQAAITPTATGIGFQITASDPNSIGDYIRNIRLVRLSDESSLQAECSPTSAAGTDCFTPEWLSLMQQVCTIRFMDWADTNNSFNIVNWNDLRSPASFTWGGWETGAPVPQLVEIAAANQAMAHAWVNTPFGATAAFVQTMSSTWLQYLNPQLHVYLENGNEPWNGKYGVGAYVTSASWNSGTVTLTVQNAVAAGIVNGATLGIHGFAPVGYNTSSGGGGVVMTVSGNTVTYPVATNPGTATQLGYIGVPSGAVAYQQFGNDDYNSGEGYQTVQWCQIWKATWGNQAGRVHCGMSEQIGNTGVVGAFMTCRSWSQGPCGYWQGIDFTLSASYFGNNSTSLSSWASLPDLGASLTFEQLYNQIAANLAGGNSEVVNGLQTLYEPNNVRITSAVWSNGVAYITPVSNALPPLGNNFTFQVVGMTPPGWNGTYVAQAGSGSRQGLIVKMPQNPGTPSSFGFVQWSAESATVSQFGGLMEVNGYESGFGANVTSFGDFVSSASWSSTGGGTLTLNLNSFPGSQYPVGSYIVVVDNTYNPNANGNPNTSLGVGPLVGVYQVLTNNSSAITVSMPNQPANTSTAGYGYETYSALILISNVITNDPRMYNFYLAAYAQSAAFGWHAVNHFNDFQSMSQYGNWGFGQNIQNYNTPRWQAIKQLVKLYHPERTPSNPCSLGATGVTFNFLLRRDLDPAANDNSPAWLNEAA